MTKLLLAFCSFVFALALAEISMRVLLPHQYHREKYARTFEAVTSVPGVCRYDSELGFFTNSNLDIRFDSEDFRTRILTNSEGFRDDEESLRNPQALFLGDSLCFGWGVQKEETYESVFEEKTGLRSLNMGVSGYGTIQEFLLFRRWSRILDVRGKTAVVAIHDNDFLENDFPIEGLYPRLIEKGRNVTFTTPIQEAFEEWMLPFQTESSRVFTRQSYVADLVVSEYLLRQRRGRIREWNERHKANNPPGQRPNPYEVFEVTLRKMRNLGAEAGLRLGFVYIPRVEVYSRPDYVDRDIPKVRAILSALSLPLLDLSKELSRPDYFPHDSHLTRRGHRTCADRIVQFVLEEVWTEGTGRQELGKLPPPTDGPSPSSSQGGRGAEVAPPFLGRSGDGKT